MVELEAMWQPHTQQQNYRTLLEAMARPGTRQPLYGLEPGSRAILAVLATLLDVTVTLSDPHDLLSDSDWTLLQCGREKPERAAYLLCSGQRQPLFEPRLGTLDSPEHSATLVIQVRSLSAGNLRIGYSGPGIRQSGTCDIEGLDLAWLECRRSWVGAFPLGVDLILVDSEHVLALPRTTRVEVH